MIEMDYFEHLRAFQWTIKRRRINKEQILPIKAILHTNNYDITLFSTFDFFYVYC